MNDADSVIKGLSKENRLLRERLAQVNDQLATALERQAAIWREGYDARTEYVSRWEDWEELDSYYQNEPEPSQPENPYA